MSNTELIFLLCKIGAKNKESRQLALGHLVAALALSEAMVAKSGGRYCAWSGTQISLDDARIVFKRKYGRVTWRSSPPL